MEGTGRVRSSSEDVNALFWFRKCLRLHDNPSLKDCLKGAATIRCIFILDPWFACSHRSTNIGIHKWRFLLESLEDLSSSLADVNLRLFVVRGQPTEVLPKLFKKWNIHRLAFDYDSEPYGKKRDDVITRLSQNAKVEVISRVSHTLYDPAEIIRFNCGRVPYSYRRFQTIISSIRLPDKPIDRVTSQDTKACRSPVEDREEDIYRLLTLLDLGFDCSTLKPSSWKGGETEALQRMKCHLKRKASQENANSERVMTESLRGSEAVIGPYLCFGCLSSRQLFHSLRDLSEKLSEQNRNVSNLYGQLMWREFIYTISTNNVGFDQAKGNPLCLQINWRANTEHLEAFERGLTGFPLIDAIMVQLNDEGWVHPLARLVIARFLTWGGLWISWEEGSKIFEENLMDLDWSLSSGFWMWSCSKSFIETFLHSLCPLEAAKKLDPIGSYVRRYLPQLKNVPAEYIHCPWKAPLSAQQNFNCIVGVHYPSPIINPDEAMRENLKKLKPFMKRSEDAWSVEKTTGTETPLPSTASTFAAVPRAVAPQQTSERRPVINRMKGYCQALAGSSQPAPEPRKPFTERIKLAPEQESPQQFSMNTPSISMEESGASYHPSPSRANLKHAHTDPHLSSVIQSTSSMDAAMPHATMPHQPMFEMEKTQNRGVEFFDRFHSPTPALHSRSLRSIPPSITTAYSAPKRMHSNIAATGDSASEPSRLLAPSGIEKRPKMVEETRSVGRAHHGNHNDAIMHDLTNTENLLMTSNNFQNIILYADPHYTSANLCQRVNLMPSLSQIRTADGVHFLGPWIFRNTTYHQIPDQLPVLSVSKPQQSQQKLFDMSNVPPLATVLPAFNHMSFCTPMPGACAVMSHSNIILPNHRDTAIPQKLS